MPRKRIVPATLAIAIMALAAVAVSIKAQPTTSKPLHIRGYLLAQLGQDTPAAGPFQKKSAIYLPGVLVRAENLGTGAQSMRDVTDLSGRFHLTVKQGGKYRICWEAEGFQPGCGQPFSMGKNAYVGNLSVQAEQRADTTTLFGRVDFKDGSPARTVEPFLNVNAFSTVEFTSPAARGRKAYVNNFGDYVMTLVPNRAPVRLVAQIENGKAVQPIDPLTGLNTAAFHRVNLQVDNIPPTLAPLIPADSAGKRLQAFRPGTSVFVTARTEDLDKDTVNIRWFADAGSGTLSAATGPNVEWKLPGRPGFYRITALAFDGKGGYSKQDMGLQVRTGGVQFAGVVDGTDRPRLVGAQVEVNGLIAVTNQAGAFKMQVPEAGRYVLNIRLAGYALSSKIYDRGILSGQWTLTRASVFTADPNLPIYLVNRRIAADCPGPIAGKVDWKAYRSLLQGQWQDGRGHNMYAPPRKEQRPQPQPVIGKPGQDNACGLGIRVEIPANSLVDAQGNAPAGNVSVALSTVDLASTEQMPGDYSVITAAGAKVMDSYGAGYVEITGGGKRYNLKAGSTAKVTLPVDAMQRQAGGPHPPSIPLLHYDEKNGAWTQDGNFTLGPGPAYVGSVKHFSYVNSDLIKTGEACVAVRSPSLPASYTLEVTVPAKVAGQAPQVKSGLMTNVAPFEHVILNLPTLTDIVLVPLVPGTRPDGSAGTVAAGVFVVNTGNAQVGPTVPGPPANLPVGPPYYTQDAGGNPTGPCSTVVTLTNLIPPNQPNNGDEFLQGLHFRATNLTELNPGNPADLNVINGVSQASRDYYDTTDPRQLRRDLSDFMSRNGFPSAQETIGKYANSGDLGFGRDMHCLNRPASDGLTDTACYVTNYGDFTTPDQDDANNAAAGTGAIATVAMEFTRIENPPGPAEFTPGAPRVVKFYVYKAAKPSTVHPGQPNGIDISANLDGKGERPVPELCVVCHGGTYLQTELTPGDITTRKPVFNTLDPTTADLGSRFLPFDLRYFTFPNSSIALNELNQGPAFRKLNTDYVRVAYNGVPPLTEPIVELIDKWYPNPGDAQQKNAQINGWLAVSPTTPQPATGAFYKDVFGRACRTCHMASPFGTYQFQNGSDFTAIIAAVQSRVCKEHVMPHARRTHDLFWTSVTPSLPGLLQLFGQTLPGFDPNDPALQCDTDGVSFTPGGAPVSAYDTQIQPIFNNNGCTGCHATATAGNAQLGLAAGSSYGNIVNHVSNENPPMVRIKPADLNNSYLWRKIDGTSSAVLPGGHNPDFDRQMPLFGTPLSAADRAALQSWINAGANH